MRATRIGPMMSVNRCGSACILVLLTVGNGVARADPHGFFSGAEVLQSCTEPVKPVAARSRQELLDAGVCAGFVGAVADSVQCDSAGIGGTQAAVPPEAGLLELALVVEKWLNAHPGDLHRAGAPLVARALAERWPCPG
jgi:hypothetical protein